MDKKERVLPAKAGPSQEVDLVTLAGADIGEQFFIQEADRGRGPTQPPVRARTVPGTAPKQACRLPRLVAERLR